MLIKKEEKDYYQCGRCEITSLTDKRMIPCPRGGCEAERLGRIIFTTELLLDKDLKTEG